jgi:hypothetical protein
MRHRDRQLNARETAGRHEQIGIGYDRAGMDRPAGTVQGVKCSGETDFKF